MTNLVLLVSVAILAVFIGIPSFHVSVSAGDLLSLISERWQDYTSIATSSPVFNLNPTVTDIPSTNLVSSSIGNVTGNVSDIAVYVNRPYGIFMLYPANWTVSTNALQDYNQLVVFYSPLENISDAFPARLTVSAIKYVQNVSLPEYTNLAMMMLNQSQQFLLRNSSEVTLAGLPAHRVVLSSKPFENSTLTFYTMQVWTASGNKLYFFSYDGETNKFNSHLPDVIRIMKSFRIVT